MDWNPKTQSRSKLPQISTSRRRRIHRRDNWEGTGFSNTLVQRWIFQSSCQQIFRDLLSAIQPWLKDWWWAWQMQLVLVAVSIWNPDSSIAVWVWNASKLPNDWACLINCILILKNSDRWTSQSLQLLTARLKDSSLEEQMGILVLMLKLLLYTVLRLKIASWHDGTTSSRHNRWSWPASWSNLQPESHLLQELYGPQEFDKVY